MLVAGGTTLAAAEVTPGPSFAVGEVRRLFTYPNLSAGYDVSADGRFVVVEDVLSESEEQRPPAIRVTENWYQEFRNREQD